MKNEPFGRVRTFGALVAERFDADPNPEVTRHRTLAVCGHGAAALRNSLAYQGLPFFKLLKALQGAALVRPPQKPAENSRWFYS